MEDEKGNEVVGHDFHLEGANQNALTIKFCPNCGNELPQGINFCSKCGRDLSKGQVPKTSEDAIKSDTEILIDSVEVQKIKPKNTKYKVLVGVLAIILLGLFFAMNKLSSKAEQYESKEADFKIQKVQNDKQMEKWSSQMVSWNKKDDENSLDSMKSGIETYQNAIDRSSKQLTKLSEVTTPLNNAYDAAVKVKDSTDFQTVFDAYADLYSNQMTNGVTDLETAKQEILGGIE
ncbi:zinc-ribbon domain-containing protein [Enterococcus asini]|uniref:zinc-ribbon domain-containing protein n=1 Tax=Enterococcus asini TaxID=57732 RepID=UPI002891D714|nr:zinc-ribbon domain-containing protein [Enterococcus asini]MDT2756071.1 zinc-ribbon domain-containing protein [Enterococcus asini]